MTKKEAIEELEGLKRWYENHCYDLTSPEEYEAIKFAIKYMEDN